MRTTISLLIKPNSSFIKLIYMYGNCRFEMSHDAFNRMPGNAPDTKEAKNMIYPECVEIITHLLKALLPPCKTILLHLLPVVCRKAPVLTSHCKIIRRCTSLHIHMK